ncbi:MAG: regulator of cell morphogenesis and NO signaling [Roseivirga sp.]|jgi:regulator of cell morphogenesis and NO signaling
MQGLQERTINELVAENYVRASVLYYFGVKFYDNQERTLTDVCTENGLNIKTVLQSLNACTKKSKVNDIRLMAYPIDLVVEYLKHSHAVFVKKRLPYIAQLIDGLGAVNVRYEALAKDLKLVFPLFVEDFIHHIHEEEDSLFVYIKQLKDFLSGENHGTRLFYAMKKHSIQEFALEHEDHEHEMDGIKKITNNYTSCEAADLHIKVLFNELAGFEKDLLVHAKIEDDILLPKALLLERQVKLRFHNIIKQN